MDKKLKHLLVSGNRLSPKKEVQQSNEGERAENIPRESFVVEYVDSQKTDNGNKINDITLRNDDSFNGMNGPKNNEYVQVFSRNVDGGEGSIKKTLTLSDARRTSEVMEFMGLEENRPFQNSGPNSHHNRLCNVYLQESAQKQSVPQDIGSENFGPTQMLNGPKVVGTNQVTQDTLQSAFALLSEWNQIVQR